MTMVFGIRDERGLWPAVFTDADAAAEFKDHQGVPGIVVPIMLDPAPDEPMEAARRAALEFLSPGARTRLDYLRDAPGAPRAAE